MAIPKNGIDCTESSKVMADVIYGATHEEKLTAVREKIIEACPELLDLTLGCVVITGIPENQTRRIIGNEIIEDDDTRDYGIGKWIILSSKARTSILKIIGHDPRLEHVLRALQKYGLSSLSLNISENKIDVWTSPSLTADSCLSADLLFYWYFATDLSGQTEATIDFLYSVLYPK